MGIFRLIGAYFAFAWRWATTSWLRFPAASTGRPPLLFFLFLLFFPIGLILVLFGFDLNDVDRWIDAQGGWLDAVGSMLFRIASGFVLLICAATTLAVLFDRARGRPNLDLTTPLVEHADAEAGREKTKPPGLGCALMALILGYFAWFGMIGP